MYEGLDDAGVHGEFVDGPPWILGHRGTPREAPENTLAGLRRAVDLGLDGFEYDLRTNATGELILLHDATLDRTSDSTGPLMERTLPELFSVDAGSWFSRRFTGEPLPLFDEALEIAGSDERGWPQHMIELKERDLVVGVARRLAELPTPLPIRVASFMRDVVIEARDVELPTMLLAVRATEDDRRFVRDERIEAYGVGPGGFRTEAGRADWSFCERWSWSVDDPDDLIEACSEPFFGFNTNEPYRAMATRALVRLAPDGAVPYPVKAPRLVVEPESLEETVRGRGEWYGSWTTSAEVRNPFAYGVEVRCGAFFPNGAFEVEGLPAAFDLDPHEVREVRFRLTGGSRAPGGDPLFAALYSWKVGTGEKVLLPGGRLLLDAPMRRVRVATADGIARRLTLLVERVADPPASITMRRQNGELLLSVENPGDLEHPHAVAHLDGETVRGGRGLRLRLPADFDGNPAGVRFSCGIEGTKNGEPRIRRWAGGVPEGLANGTPGLLIPLALG